MGILEVAGLVGETDDRGNQNLERDILRWEGAEAPMSILSRASKSAA